ncbi:MAG: aspartate--tRNA(Asn) ligase [Candidatus Levybacteria bacterium]|nr:aspartate--tRNA(Asn) ligase [Candidatus Levybacteria bacterium]
MTKQRSLIRDCPQHIGQEARLSGWVQTVRAHGKIAFFDLRDRSGILQIGAFTPELAKQVADLHPQDVVSVTGIVKKRGENYINPDAVFGDMELEATRIIVLHRALEMPFDMGGKELHVELPTLLDYRSLTLKHHKISSIFIIQAALADQFRKLARELDCLEIFVPTIAAGATEGGSEVFPIEYFEHRAFLTQSPQLYKQMLVGVFERVFTIAKAYRAEPSVTTRHLTEATQMDIEIGFIEKFEELLDALEFVGTGMIKNVSEQHGDILKQFEVAMPLVPTTVPRLTFRKAQEIVSQRTGRDLSKELDLNPEDEKEICEWAKEKHKSDFVTITHFPTKKRAFYTLPDPENPEYSLSYDLLFRGLEILSGSQRIHDYEQLVSAMKAKNVSPDNFAMYLMAFQYGMPPEGGFSFGLERLTMKLLELANVREASLFPRDMERVDMRLSLHNEEPTKTSGQKNQ